MGTVLMLKNKQENRPYVMWSSRKAGDYIKRLPIASLLYRMLRHYEKKKQGEMSIVNLHQFKNNLYSPFSDPILPVFKAKPTDFIYDGTAIFKDDYFKVIAHGIDDEIFQLIDNDHYLKYLSIPKYSVVFGHVRSHVHKKLD